MIALVQTVAKIPWGEARTIEEVLEKNTGTCTGKHVLLKSCLDALEIPNRITVCTFHWSEQGLPFPDALKEILDEGEWKHGHNFLQIQNEDGEWIDVDVIWDPALKDHGFLSFPEDWDGNSSFIGINPIIERWDDADMSMKKQWVAELSEEARERRERFLQEMFKWIKTLRKG